MLSPLFDKVLLSPLTPEGKTESGLFLPGDPEVVEARVLSVGPGKVVAGVGFVETVVQPGQLVLVPKDAGREVPGGVLVAEGEILGLVK